MKTPHWPHWRNKIDNLEDGIPLGIAVHMLISNKVRTISECPAGQNVKLKLNKKISIYIHIWMGMFSVLLTFEVVPCVVVSPTDRRRNSVEKDQPVTGTSAWCPRDSRPRQPSPVAEGVDRGPASRRSWFAPAPIHSIAEPIGHGQRGSDKWPASPTTHRFGSEDRHLQCKGRSIVSSS